MEGIREQLVKKPANNGDFIKKGAILAAALLLAVLVEAVFAAFLGGFYEIIGGVVGIGALIGGWFLAGNLNVEYEYSIISDEMSVNKISNKRSRKNLCAVNLRTAEGFYRGEKTLHDSTEINACGDGERYSIVYNDPKYGRTTVVFTPDERTLEAVKPYLPRLQ